MKEVKEELARSGETIKVKETVASMPTFEESSNE